MKNARLRRGMTLLELTVALVVGGAALAAGGATFVALIDRRTALLAETQREERALAARRVIVDWIASADFDEDAPGGAGNSLRATAHERAAADGRLADDTLRLATVLHGVRTRVQLAVDRTGIVPALVADVAETGGATQHLTLVEGVDGFAVRALTSDATWRRGWAGGALRPLAIQLELTPAPGQSLSSAVQDKITVSIGAAR